jgi:hypothetical protein
MSTHPRPLAFTAVAAMAFLVAAAPAHAWTEQTLLPVANTLDADYDDLLDDVQNAGASGHTALIARFDDLEIRRADLHARRDGISPCGCTQLDPVIAGIDATSDEVAVIIDGWGGGAAKEPQPFERSDRWIAIPMP